MLRPSRSLLGTNSTMASVPVGCVAPSHARGSAFCLFFATVRPVYRLLISKESARQAGPRSSGAASRRWPEAAMDLLFTERFDPSLHRVPRAVEPGVWKQAGFLLSSPT